MMMMMGVLVWVGGGRLCSDHVGMCVVQAVWYGYDMYVCMYVYGRMDVSVWASVYKNNIWQNVY